MLAANGYRQYEVSAFARDGRVSRHNLNYWLFGDYVAAGAGAHGKISDRSGVFRYVKPANPLQYMKTCETGAAPPAASRIGAEDLLFEFMLNALRLTDGFTARLFLKEPGWAHEELESAMQGAREKGLVSRESPATLAADRAGAAFPERPAGRLPAAAPPGRGETTAPGQPGLGVLATFRRATAAMPGSQGLCTRTGGHLYFQRMRPLEFTWSVAKGLISNCFY